MPFFYSKPIGGRNFGTSVHADRHGIRRGPWRFRIGLRAGVESVFLVSTITTTSPIDNTSISFLF
ncbi:hypothetical protein LY76DRAFT_649568 [Colletotrichum caudatum]|nr:hypothetical protein LY76DRAFT_649568 [Colletotrichum caudatum]